MYINEIVMVITFYMTKVTRDTEENAQRNNVKPIKPFLCVHSLNAMELVHFQGKAYGKLNMQVCSICWQNDISLA